MTTCREAVQQARQRGIQLRVDADGNLKVSGPYSDSFVDWAKRHKDGLIAELRRPCLDELLNQARTDTDFTLVDCKTLFSPLDLQLLVTGELTIPAARHFLEQHARTVCRSCLGGGCTQCDFFGRRS